jgi:mannose/fructose/N-acetylgalactosamine-specific phosphotransferase system component IID
MSGIVDKQIFIVVWTYKDTGNHWSTLHYGYDDAVEFAKNLAKTNNTYAIWITVAVRVYKPEVDG